MFFMELSVIHTVIAVIVAVPDLLLVSPVASLTDGAQVVLGQLSPTGRAIE